MAKTVTKSSGYRGRSAPPAKSSVKAPPGKPAAKAAPAKPAPKAAPPAKAAPAAKAPAAKAPPPKPAPRKAAPAKATATKAKLSGTDQPPASEAEIIGAVSGRLAGRAAGGGMSWLGSRPRTETEEPLAEAPAASAAPPAGEAPPAPEMPPVLEIPLLEEEPAVTEVPVIIAPIIIEDADEPPPPVLLVEEVVVIVAPEETGETSDGPPEPAPPVVEPPPVAATVAPDSETVSRAASNGESLTEAFKNAGKQLGWALALQGVILAAFCGLVSRGVPVSGLANFLAHVIPLFAMILVVAAFFTHQNSSRVLETLESERLRYRSLLSIPEGTDTLTNQRKLAHWPAQAILGFLLLAWFFIGITVWFL